MQQALFAFDNEPQNDEDVFASPRDSIGIEVGNGGEWLVAAVLKNPAMVPQWLGRCFIEFQEQGRVFDLRATSADSRHEFKVQVKTATATRVKGEGRQPAYDFCTSKIDRKWARNSGRDPYSACRRLYDPSDLDLFAFVAEDRFSAVFMPASEVVTTSIAIAPCEFTIENQRASLARSLEVVLARRRSVAVFVPRIAG